MNNAFEMHDHRTSIKFLSSKFVSNELKLLISPIFSLLAVVFVEYSKFRKSFALISIIYVKANWHDLFFVLHRPPINKCSSQSTHFTSHLDTLPIKSPVAVLAGMRGLSLRSTSQPTDETTLDVRLEKCFFISHFTLRIYKKINYRFGYPQVNE